MAGILDYFGLGSTPDGGILSGDAWQPPKTAAAPATVSPWADRLGLFGAALQDAGANFSGHPESATRLSGYNKAMLQQKLQQALAGATSTDPAVRAQAYAIARANGIDTAPFEKAAAAGAMPDLLKQMQPQLNPVQSTPAVTPDNPVGSPMRQAAITAPLESQPTLSDALSHVNSPELQAQMAPEIIKDQIARQDKAMTTLPPDQVAQLGFRPGTIVQKDAYGNLKVAQASDVKSKEAVQQVEEQQHDAAVFNNGLPMTAAQKAADARARSSEAETRRHNSVTEFAASHPFGQDAMVDDKGNPLSGDAFLSSLAKTNPGLANQVKAIASYRQPAPGRGTKQGIAMLNLVNQYAPGYDASTFPTKQKARNDYGTGTQGKSIVAVNNAMAHLDLLGQLADAMGNGNIQMLNAARQAYEQQVGSPAPTTFDAVRNIAAQEVVKSVVPGGGGVAERAAAAEDFKKAASPAQIHGAINGVKGLFSGQLGNYRQQYKKLTGLDDFDDMLSEETKALSHMPVARAVAGGNAAPAPQDLPRTVAKVNSDTDYAKLPSGAVFTGPDGVQRRKP